MLSSEIQIIILRSLHVSQQVSFDDIGFTGPNKFTGVIWGDNRFGYSNL